MQKAVTLVTGPPWADQQTTSTLQEAIDIAWAIGGHIHQGPMHSHTDRRHLGYVVCSGDCVEQASKRP